MLSSVLVLVLVYSSAVQACCTPKRWQSYVSVMGGYSGNGTKPSMHEGGISVSVDEVGQRIAAEEHIYMAGKWHYVKVIADFTKNVRYVIYEGACHTQPSGEWKNVCLPEDATMTGSGYMGSDTDSLFVDFYKVGMSKEEKVYATMAKDCVPVSVAYTQTKEQSGGLEAYAFFDFAHGIEDLTVFQLPSECSSELDFVPAYLMGRRFGWGKSGLGVL